MLKRSWLPTGPEKALVLRFMSLPFVLSEVLALTIYPWISVKFGAFAMPLFHGCATAAFAAVWALLVRDDPPPALAGAPPPADAAGATPAGGSGGTSHGP